MFNIGQQQRQIYSVKFYPTRLLGFILSSTNIYLAMTNIELVGLS